MWKKLFNNLKFRIFISIPAFLAWIELIRKGYNWISSGSKPMTLPFYQNLYFLWPVAIISTGISLYSIFRKPVKEEAIKPAKVKKTLANTDVLGQDCLDLANAIHLFLKNTNTSIPLGDKFDKKFKPELDSISDRFKQLNLNDTHFYALSRSHDSFSELVSLWEKLKNFGKELKHSTT